jgi:hypothetical protein
MENNHAIYPCIYTLSIMVIFGKVLMHSDIGLKSIASLVQKCRIWGNSTGGTQCGGY